MTPRAGELLGLTHLRALAIVLVLVYHYALFPHPAWVERVGAFGWTGVDLFFVLSGFLIARQLFERGSSLRLFYFKRAVRIVPAYLVVVAAYFTLPALHEREALPPLWRFLTFTQNFELDLRRWGTFSHAWSLCIEEQFYLVLPLALLVPLVRRHGAALLALLVALGVVVRVIAYRRWVVGSELAWYEHVYYPTWSRLDGLLVGIALAATYVFRPSWWRARHHGVLLWVAIAAWFTTWWLFADPVSLLGSALVFPTVAAVFGVFVYAAVSSSIRSVVTHWLATLSYALYLTHKACIHVVQHALGGLDADGNAMFVCCIVACVAVALALHLVVERPLLAWRARVLAPAK